MVPEATTDTPLSDEPSPPGSGSGVAVRTRGRSTWALAGRLVAWLILLGLAVPVVLRILWAEVGPSAVIVSLLPWATVAAVAMTVVLLLARWWSLLVIAALLSLVGLAWLVPLYVPAADPPLLRRVSIATVNTLYGHGDAAQIVAMVRAHDLDLLSVQELTLGEYEALTAAGLGQLMPYHRAKPAKGASGTGLWSREPLTDVVESDLTVFALVEATTETRSGLAVRAVAAHSVAPDPFRSGAWRRDADVLYGVMKQALAQHPVVVLAGDLNATLDNPPIRRLEELGLVDAVTAAGAGFLPTYPNDSGLFPVVAIDHVMARGLVARSVEVVSIDRSDHKALITTMVG